MADKIKKYFQKKKADAKFKLAGPGHRLNEESSHNQPKPHSTKHQHSGSGSRSAPSAEAKQAAAAALARMEGGGRRHDQAAFNTSLAAIQAQVRMELEAEKKAQSQTPQVETKTEAVVIETSTHFAVQGVFFKCPMIGSDILTKDEWHKKIREFLYEQLEEERGLTACLIIQSCNKNREKVEMCVETLFKYLENIIHNPTEEKYRKIRLTNKVYQERVAPIEGAQDFLLAAGFDVMKLPHGEGEEDFFVFTEDVGECVENLQILCDALKSAEPIALELDRNLQVLLPSQVAERVELPPVFFSVTAEELKREQQLRAEAIEKSMMLRTKAMREKEEQREMRRYRYALIRIRFPDGVFLQGTFTVYEKVDAVRTFVSENIIDEDRPFILSTATGHRLTEEDYDHSLLDLRLVPASILIFTWETLLPNESAGQSMYLKPEIMLLLQSL
ncbi:UBX domain-containing protein 6 [Gryllus bimaculatus]|nr:UBX domain-containing protein 6 [Gryllus bimaculatus]